MIEEALRGQLEEINQGVRSLLERIDSLIGIFPEKLRIRFKDRIHEVYQTEDIEFSHKFPFRDTTWKVRLHFSVGRQYFFIVENLDAVGQIITSRNIAVLDELYELVFQNKDAALDQQGLLDFIKGSLLHAEMDFETIYASELANFDPNIVELVRILREKICELAGHKTEITELKNDINDVRSAIERSIKELKKSAKALENTKAFLGKSKTIRGIREDIELTISFLHGFMPSYRR